MPLLVAKRVDGTQRRGREERPGTKQILPEELLKSERSRGRRKWTDMSDGMMGWGGGGAFNSMHTGVLTRSFGLWGVGASLSSK